MIIWITGLSGAGKTTLCNALRDTLRPVLPELVILDGDDVRTAFGQDLGYHKAGRLKQLHRLQSMATVLAKQGLVVIVGVLYAHPDVLEWNRENMPDYFEIYLDASLETVKARDAKGIYAMAERGDMSDVVGIDIEWHVPKNPNLTFDADYPLPPLQLAEQVIAEIPRLKSALSSRDLGSAKPRSGAVG